MKKWIAWILTAVLALTWLTGCEAKNGSSDGDERPLIMCTLFPQTHLVTQIGGDAVQVRMLAQSGTDGHAYEPTPADMIAISEASLFVYMGGETEVWVENILTSLGNDMPATLRLLDCAGDALIEEKHEGHDHAETEELYDEHIWTSPKLYAKMAEAVRDALTALLPEQAESFAQKTEQYLAQLDTLDAEFRTIADEATQDTLVFGDKFPFKYLLAEYGWHYMAAFDGCGEDMEPSASVMAQLIDYVKANEISVVFCLSESSTKIAQTICDETGAALLTLHSCHTLTSEEAARGETYLSLMQDNAQKIRQALTQ